MFNSRKTDVPSSTQHARKWKPNPLLDNDNWENWHPSSLEELDDMLADAIRQIKARERAEIILVFGMAAVISAVVFIAIMLFGGRIG